MDELLKRRIERHLDGLSDAKAYQVLDYIEFLTSKYGDRAAGTSPFQRFAESVEDTLRAGRVPVAAIRGTMGVFDAASRVMKGLADAGRAVVDELQSEDATPTQPARASDVSEGGIGAGDAGVVDASEDAGRPDSERSESA